MNVAYFAGCSPQSTTKELDASTRRTAQALGFQLKELREATCCGSVELKLNNDDLFYSLNARTLAMAERESDILMTVCNTCQLMLSQANRRLKADGEMRERANRVLAGMGLKYEGRVEVKHYLWLLLNDLGLERLAERISKPASGLKVAPFYGCHILRPKEALGFEDPDEPHSLEDLINLMKAVPVDYPGKIKCCGFHNLPYDKDLAIALTGQYLLEAKKAGAECLVTPCPLCFTMLDGYQAEAEKKLKTIINLPVFHLPQLIGLALGLDPEALMLGRNMVPVGGVLSRFRGR